MAQEASINRAAAALAQQRQSVVHKDRKDATEDQLTSTAGEVVTTAGLKSSRPAAQLLVEEAQRHRTARVMNELGREIVHEAQRLSCARAVKDLTTTNLRIIE